MLYKAVLDSCESIPSPGYFFFLQYKNRYKRVPTGSF